MLAQFRSGGPPHPDIQMPWWPKCTCRTCAVLVMQVPVPERLMLTIVSPGVTMAQMLNSQCRSFDTSSAGMEHRPKVYLSRSLNALFGLNLIPLPFGHARSSRINDLHQALPSGRAMSQQISLSFSKTLVTASIT